jgi:hypothetical protein
MAHGKSEIIKTHGFCVVPKTGFLPRPLQFSNKTDKYENCIMDVNRFLHKKTVDK